MKPSSLNKYNGVDMKKYASPKHPKIEKAIDLLTEVKLELEKQEIEKPESAHLILEEVSEALQRVKALRLWEATGGDE